MDVGLVVVLVDVVVGVVVVVVDLDVGLVVVVVVDVDVLVATVVVDVDEDAVIVVVEVYVDVDVMPVWQNCPLNPLPHVQLKPYGRPWLNGQLSAMHVAAASNSAMPGAVDSDVAHSVRHV